MTIGPFEFDMPIKAGWFGMWYRNDGCWQWFEVEFSESKPLTPDEFPAEVKAYLNEMIEHGASGPEPLIYLRS